jgi:hypothetical protein
MVNLTFTLEEAQLLVSVIDGAQFNGNVAQAEEVFAAIQQLRDIKARLLEPETQAKEEN